MIWRTLAILLSLSSFALAQPAESNRILRAMDFEERRLGNAEDLPMHWLKVEGPEFPHYVNGALSVDRSRSGQYSFKMELNGGNLLYRYDPAQIKVIRGAHYRVDAYATTTVMPHARAQVTAYFADADKKPIVSTTRYTQPYSSKVENDDWKHLAIELSADDPNAMYLVVELGLLQPANLGTGATTQQAIKDEDIAGCAWFDDVQISQVPQVTMTTERAGNIFRKSDPLRLSVLVNDRFMDDLAAQVVIKDAAGQQVYQRSGALDIKSATQVGPTQRRMSLELPNDLKAGWYEASLIMTSRGAMVGKQSLDIVLLADDGNGLSPDERFGIIATSLPFEGWSELPEILPNLGVGRVKLAVWSALGDIQETDGAAFDELLQRFGELGIVPTACLIDLPPKMNKAVNGKSWAGLLKAKKADWQPELALLISRHANHLDRWQLGSDGSDSFVTQPEMRDVYSMLYGEFSNLITKPDLAMPWPAWYEMEGKMPATIALSVPPNVLPSQLPLYMEDVRQGKAKDDSHNLSLSLQALDASQYGREVQIRDLAQRVVYAMSAGAKRIDLPLPFTVQRNGDQIVKQPNELLIVVRTLLTTLRGATYKGKIPVAEGVEAFLFDRDGTGIVCLWDRGSVGGVKQLEINPGDRPTMVDLWGNSTPLLSSSKSREDGKLQLTVGPMPVFLIDIDGGLAQLRASVAFDRPLIESSFQQHARHLKFTNPYKTAIAGSIKLKSPPGWTVSPPMLQFSLNPGETYDREVTLEFPYNSVGGNKSINAEFTVQSDRNGSFVVPLALKLGLSDVGMQTVAMRDGKDVVVQQIISNYGEKPISYTTFAIFPGQARQERLAINLAAGRTTIKRYRFKDATITPGVKLRVGIKELVGTRILNDEVPIQ